MPAERSCVDVPESFRETVIGQLTRRLSHCLEFPEASVGLALLGGASAAASTAFAVQYKSGTSVQLGIYSLIEQPPSTPAECERPARHLPVWRMALP